MANVAVDLPQELLDQLARSRFAKIDADRRVRVALAIHLFLGEEISVGRAAELTGYPLEEFHDLLRDLGLPTVIYDRADYDRDQHAVDRLRERLSGASGR